MENGIKISTDRAYVCTENKSTTPSKHVQMVTDVSKITLYRVVMNEKNVCDLRKVCKLRKACRIGIKHIMQYWYKQNNIQESTHVVCIPKTR